MQRLPHVLLALYLILFVACAIDPYDRTTWWPENIPVLLIVVVLVRVYRRRIRLSNTAHLLMAVLVYMSTIGGYYTFERVPFGWVTDTFGFERNHYDRVAHFAVGLYAYAIAEVLWRLKLVRSLWVLLLFPVFSIFTMACLWEIMEWQYAVIKGGDSGIAFLGSQGDIWDAQKDMLADGLGAVCAVLFFCRRHRTRLREGLAVSL